MSSNLTPAEEQSLPKRADDCPARVARKRHNFHRSRSIEKIIKFNTYICSQHYYILPAILAWLRTSQTVLKSYAERSIYLVKSFIYHTALYKALESRLKTTSSNLNGLLLRFEPRRLIKMLLAKMYDSISLVSEEVKLKILTATVYFAFFLIFSQLLVCVYFLSLAAMPGGLAFLLTAISYISYLNYNCLRFILIKKALKESDKENRCDNTMNEKYIRPKNILGKRTISNLNLF